MKKPDIDVCTNSQVPPGFIPCGQPHDLHAYVCDREQCRAEQQKGIQLAQGRLGDAQFRVMRKEQIEKEHLTEENRKLFKPHPPSQIFTIVSNKVRDFVGGVVFQKNQSAGCTDLHA